MTKANAAEPARSSANTLVRVGLAHQQVDAKLNEGWAAWDSARDNTNGKTKDELKALLIWTEQLEPIYAQFTPQIQLLLNELRTEIGDEENSLVTRSDHSVTRRQTHLRRVLGNGARNEGRGKEDLMESIGPGPPGLLGRLERQANREDLQDAQGSK